MKMNQPQDGQIEEKSSIKFQCDSHERKVNFYDKKKKKLICLQCFHDDQNLKKEETVIAEEDDIFALSEEHSM